MLGQLFAGQARLNTENVNLLRGFHFVSGAKKLGLFLLAFVHSLAANHAHAATIDHNISSLICFLRDGRRSD